MKRPEIYVLFESVPGSPAALGVTWLEYLSLRNGSLSRFYARVSLDIDTGELELQEECLDLHGPQDLLQRSQRDTEFAFSMRIPYGFANADTTFILFRDGPARTSSLLRIEPNITRFVEEQSMTRDTFTSFLLQLADMTESQSLLAGFRLPWVTLTPDLIESGGSEDSWPLIGAWRHATVNENRLAENWKLGLETIRQTTMGWRYVTKWPHSQR